MKISRWICSLLIVCVLCLCGCSNGGNGPVSTQPIKSVVEYDRMFRITCLSNQYIYDSKQMEKESPLHFTLQLEYIGEEPSVTIWRNEAIGGIEMMHANGESVLPLVIGDTLGSTELKKGEVYTITVWTGESEYDYLGGFSPGDYIAAAHVSFSLDYDLEKDVLCFIDLPFVIV